LREDILKAQIHREYNLALENGRKDLLGFTLLTFKNYEVNWHHREVYKVLTQFQQGKIKRLMIFQPPQTGKALEVSTPILTNRGWIPHGDIEVGDLVLNQEGKPVKVYDVTDHYDIDSVQVNFDIDSIVCANQHESQIINNGKTKIVEASHLTRYFD